MQDIILNNGVKMPIIGLGTFKSENGDECYHAVLEALKAGYRHIDTAMGYGNEESVGKAIKDSGIPREEIFITTKLQAGKLGYKAAKFYLEESLERLGTDYVDLYLIHWPSHNKEVNIHTWKAFEELYLAGKAKAIGVSNFQIHHLEDLLGSASIKPMVNQVELHPFLTQKELQEYLVKHDIQIESYGPFAKGLAFENDYLKELAQKYNKSVANIVCRYGIERNIIMIPKSVTTSRIIDNFKVFDFNLTAEEVAKIDSLNLGKRVYTDPDNCPFVTNVEVDV